MRRNRLDMEGIADKRQDYSCVHVGQPVKSILKNVQFLKIVQLK